MTALVSNGASTVLAEGDESGLQPLETVAQAVGVRQITREVVISSELESSDNYDLREDSAGQTTIWTNTLTASQSTTGIEDQFDASVSGDFRVSDVPDQGTESRLDNPSVRLSYSRSNDTTEISSNLFFNTVDIEFSDPLDRIDNNGQFDDTTGTGRVNTSQLGANIFHGRDGPVTIEASIFGRIVDYEDATDPSLDDSETLTLGGELGLLATDSGYVLFGTELDFYSEPDTVEERQSAFVYTGFRANVSPLTTAELRFGYETVDATRENQVDRSEDGVAASGLISHLRPNGSVTGQVSTRLLEVGRQNTLEVNRGLILSDTSSLSFGGGLVQQDTSGVQPFLSLTYSNEGPTSSNSFSLSQTADVDNNGEYVLASSAGWNYSYAFNRLTFFDLNARAGVIRPLSDDSLSTDTTRTTIDVSLVRDLTPLWSTRAGLRHQTRVEDRDGDDSAVSQSNAVFVRIDRVFQAR